MIYSGVLSFLIFLNAGVYGQCDKYRKLIKDELIREFSYLSKQEIPVYYMSYNYSHVKSIYLTVQNGEITSDLFKAMKKYGHDNYITINVRVGSPAVDQTKELENIQQRNQHNNNLVMFGKSTEQHILQELWLNSHEVYEESVQKYKKVLEDKSVKGSTEKYALDFLVDHKPVNYYEDTIPIKKDEMDVWKQNIQKLSALANHEQDDIKLDLSLINNIERKSFFSSQGDDIVQNNQNISFNIMASIVDNEGETYYLYEQYHMDQMKNFPPYDSVKTKILSMIELLKKIKNAPKAEAYSGPAILSGSASGVYFHEIVGHRVEADRLKSKDDAHTFKNKVGTKVFPEFISIDFDPTISKYKGITMTGNYKFDDEGTPAEKVTVVQKGVLKDFLRSRKPLDTLSKSNGHGRTGYGERPVARQSNMIIQSDKKMSDEELRNTLIKKLKKNNQEFGYYIEQVQGGHTHTLVYIPNYFEVKPTVAYKIFADGRPDQLVKGVRMIGTPLLMFSQINASGTKLEAFTGFCGAESGMVPVSAVSPAFLFDNIEVQRPVDSRQSPQILKSPKKLKNKDHAKF
jgi:TldD protein